MRNLVHTVNGLPDDYAGKLTVLLNDHSIFVVVRNILLLMFLGTIADKRKAVDIALHFWYSAFIPQEYHAELLSIAASILTNPGTLKASLGNKADLTGFQRRHAKILRSTCGLIQIIQYE